MTAPFNKTESVVSLCQRPLTQQATTCSTNNSDLGPGSSQVMCKAAVQKGRVKPEDEVSDLRVRTPPNPHLRSRAVVLTEGAEVICLHRVLGLTFGDSNLRAARC